MKLGNACCSNCVEFRSVDTFGLVFTFEDLKSGEACDGVFESFEAFDVDFDGG